MTNFPNKTPKRDEPETGPKNEGTPPDVEKEIPSVDPAKASPDPFDPARLRLDQSFIETAGVKKLLTTVPVDKARSEDYIRTHPSDAYRETIATITLKADRETYVVVPEIAEALPNECVFSRLYTYMTRQGAIRLWPVRLPGPDGRITKRIGCRRRWQSAQSPGGCAFCGTDRIPGVRRIRSQRDDPRSRMAGRSVPGIA